MKNTLPFGRVLQRYRHTAEAYHNTDSVVFYDNTFGQNWQENDKIARFLVSEALVFLMRWPGKEPLYFFVYSDAEIEHRDAL